MKYLFVCTATLVAGISLAGVVDFDKLNLEQKDAFSTPGTKVTTSGATYQDGKYMLEGELSVDSPAALVVTPTEDFSSTEIKKFTLNFTVGFADEIPAYEGAALGFAFKAVDKAAYWNGLAWQEITLTTPVAEESEVTVLVEYDGRATTAQTPAKAKVRFSIDGVKYGWYDVGTIGSSNIVKAFGSGIVTSIAGTTHTIVTEIIPIKPSEKEGDVKIEFTPTQIAALEAAGVDPANPTALTTKQNNGQTMLTNYILFGKAKSSEITEDVMPKAVGVPIAAEAGNVAVKVSGLNVQKVTGTEVKYVLMGSTDNVNFTQIDEATTADTFEFANTTDYRYFKVKAVIEYTTPANDTAE